MTNTEIEQRCHVLRQQLKVWENSFTAQNGGRKARREDIKADANISQKYKEYNKLRLRLSGKTTPQTPSKRATADRPSPNAKRTPKAQSKCAESTTFIREKKEQPSEDPDQAHQASSSPQGPNFIGPTPQRDGFVLGLFDMLPIETPSKKRAVLGNVEFNVLQTPTSKMQEAMSELSPESRVRGERTPISAGKRFFLNQFVTPKKRKVEEEDECTPTSTAHGFSTPAFLRRDDPMGITSDTNESTPRPAPWKRRGLGRSLGDMMQAMRKSEDDRLDQEMNIMRELEMEEEALLITGSHKKSKVSAASGQAEMPLGSDRAPESDEGEEEGGSPSGLDRKPNRAWRKKGLKRQTRHVIMRPNLAKPKPQPAFLGQSDAGKVLSETLEAAEDNHESDDHDSEYASNDSHTPRKQKSGQKKVEARDETGPKGSARNTTRKSKRTANANFRKLKIKGKSGNGVKGKIGRRRKK